MSSNAFMLDIVPQGQTPGLLFFVDRKLREDDALIGGHDAEVVCGKGEMLALTRKLGDGHGDLLQAVAGGVGHALDRVHVRLDAGTEPREAARGLLDALDRAAK